MRSRRNIAPRVVRSKAVLVRYLLLALAVAVVGACLSLLCIHFIPPASAEPVANPEDAPPPSALTSLAGTLVVVTIVATLALIFFGIRAYMAGHKGRVSITNSRMKINR